MDLRLANRHPLAEIGGQAAQLRLVDLDPGPLHLPQHRDQPTFQLLVQCRGPGIGQPHAQGVAQPECAVGCLRNVARCPLRRQLRQGEAGAAGAGDRLEPGDAVPQMQAG